MMQCIKFRTLYHVTGLNITVDCTGGCMKLALSLNPIIQYIQVSKMSGMPESNPLHTVQFYTKKRGHANVDDKPDLHASGTSSLDPDVARHLFEEGAFFFFLDVPEKTEFGIDCTSWNVGEKFKGMKMIPPGIHFIYYSAVSKDDVTSPRTGFFHNFKSKEVLVKRWDPRHEGMSVQIVTEEETERLTKNTKNLDGFLGAYPYASYKKWISLTKWMTEATVERLAPLGVNRLIFSVQQLQSLKHFSSRESATERLDSATKKIKSDQGTSEADLPDMKVIEATRIRFSDFSSRPHISGATPSDITRLNMDRSLLLEELISSTFHKNELEILAEIQFSFVCFLVGQVYDAFEQWKKLISFLCCCEEAIRIRPRLFLDFIGVLFFELKEVPKDFFVDIVSQENFLTQTLQSFFSLVENSEGSREERVEGRGEGLGEELQRKSRQFREYLQKQFRWDFSTEVGEDAPTIVDDL